MRLIVQCFPVALILSLGVLANAQTPAADNSASGAKPSVTEQARALRKQGMALQDRGEFESARNVYLSAWKLDPRPGVMANLAIVETQIKRYRDAAEHCAFALRELPKDVKSEDLTAFKTNCDTALRHVGSITIAVEQPGAEIVANGKTVGTSPLADPVFVDPGQAVFEAHLGERRADRYEIDVAAGSALRIKLALRDPPTTPKPALDPTNDKPAPQPVRPTEEKSQPNLVVPAVIGGALTLTGLALGIGFGAKASSSGDEAKRLTSSLSGQAPCISGPAVNSATCQSARTADDNRRTYRTIEAVSYVGAGVAAAGTIAYLLLARPKSSQVALTPVIGPTQAHLVFQSTF